MNIMAIAKTTWTFAEPAVKAAGQGAIVIGTLVAANAIIKTTGKLAGKGIDGVRHIIGYTDNLFGANNPTASGNRKKSLKRRNSKTKAVKSDVTSKKK